MTDRGEAYSESELDRLTAAAREKIGGLKTRVLR